jgi:membrane protein YqaA with SNARE-associated domain
VAALALIGGIFLIALVSAFIPVFSLELALIVAAAAGVSLGMLLALVVAAAAGQMIAKSCFFVGGRTAFAWHRGRRKDRRPRGGERLRRVVNRAAGQRHAAAATVLISAITGLPPFALVAALAGAGRIRLRSFLVMGFAGRSARFAGLMLVPGAANLF